MKVLITVPRIKEGGIYYYFESIRNKFRINPIYFRRGKCTSSENIVFRFMNDYIDFFKTIHKEKPEIIHINTSFEVQSLIRDLGFLLIALPFKSKLLVYILGWNDVVEQRHSVLLTFTLFILRKVQAIIVQASYQKNKLLEWKIRVPVIVETGVVDEDLLNIVPGKEKYLNKDKINLLFLARVEKFKGIYLTFEVYEMLKKKYPRVRLYIAGTGEELQRAEEYIKMHTLTDVEFTGFIVGDEKAKLFRECDIYLFPTLHWEGTPSSVMEAMAFGLPVITRPMGGLADLIKNEVNGFMSDSLNPEVFTNFIEYLIEDPELFRTISQNNIEEARNTFYSGAVVIRLEKCYASLLAS